MRGRGIERGSARETRSRVSRFYRFPDELGKKFSLLVSESLKKRRKNRKNFRIARLTEAKNRLYRKWKIRLVVKIENEPWTFKRVIFKWPSIGFLLTWFERFIQSQIVEGVIELENGLSHQLFAVPTQILGQPEERMENNSWMKKIIFFLYLYFTNVLTFHPRTWTSCWGYAWRGKCDVPTVSQCC